MIPIGRIMAGVIPTLGLFLNNPCRLVVAVKQGGPGRHMGLELLKIHKIQQLRTALQKQVSFQGRGSPVQPDPIP